MGESGERLHQRGAGGRGITRLDFLRLSGAGIAGTSLLGVSGCGSVFGSGDSGGGESGQTFNTYVPAEIPDLVSTTATSFSSLALINNINEGLYRLDENEEPQPAMAGETRMSEDGTSYTFTLREGVTWSDGEPVTSQDFRYAWLRAMSPDTAGSYAYLLTDHIEGGAEFAAGEAGPETVGVEAPDDRTLEVRLGAPKPFFLSLTALPAYFPLKEEFVDAQGDEFGLEAGSLLYNGPYELAEFTPASGARLRKREGSWDAANVDVEGVDIRVVGDQSTAINLYESGELDAATLTSEQVERYEDSPQFSTTTFFATYYMPMNFEDPVMANESIRRAVQTGVDTGALTRTILNNGSEPAEGFVPPGMAGPGDQSFREAAGATAPEYDPDRARELYARGVEELGEEPTLTLTIGDDSDAQDTGTFILAQLQENLGANVEVDAQPLDSLLERLESGDYQIGVISWFADFNDPVNFLDLSTSESSFNYSNFENEEFDGLIADAKAEQDPEARMQTLIEAERILIEDSAALAPIYHAGTATVTKPYVENSLVHPYGPSAEYKYLRIQR